MTNPALADLPDDVREIIQPHMEQSAETLDAISVAISARRDEAKAARTSLGIEQTWKECEEAYVGIDDANRSEYQDAKWSKPMSASGPVTTGVTPRQTDYKSTAYVRLTARYVDAGAAKLGEILLPFDDKAFSFTETPVPELLRAKDDTSQVVHDGLGNVPLTRPARPGETPPAPVPATPIPPAPGASAVPPGPAPVLGGAPSVGAVPPVGAPATPQVPLTVKDLAEENIEMAREKAKRAEKRIYDWMVESQYPGEMRKVIFDGSRIGVGVLKGPFPKPSKAMKVTKAKSGRGIELEIEKKIQPGYAWVDPWNVFPDPACGENIHNGDFIFERDYLSTRQVRDLKKLPGYIDRQIDRVLAEGPNKENENNDGGSASGPNVSQRKGRYEVWYYYGSLTREEMNCICTEAGKPLGEDEIPADKQEVYAIVTLINTCVVRATINPLDSGTFPYHSVPWQRRAGHWAGIGVAEQIRMPQRTVNAATRAMLNNAGNSAGSQIVVDQGSIKPADGKWPLTPDKIWYKTGDAMSQDVRTAFMAIQIPNTTPQLMSIIEYAMRLGEESTSIPLITQGQSGPTTPDTFGAAQLQNNNANQLLRSIGYAFDDYITEPVVRASYEWLLLDPDVPDDEKGDFQINAHGSIALVEQAIQDQTIAQMGPMTLDHRYKIDPAKWAKKFLKTKRIDPVEVQYTDEELAKMAAAPPVKDPTVQAAEVNAASREKIAAGQAALGDKKLGIDHDKLLTESTVELHTLELKRELAMLDYANRNQISLNEVKGSLAKTAMELDAQEKLNTAGLAVDLAKHRHQPNNPRRSRKSPLPPPVQVPGRAADGHAFDQTQ